MNRPAEPPTLSDGRVTLRGHRTGDLFAVARHGRDPEMTRWTRVPHPYEDRHAVEYLSDVATAWSAETEFNLAIDVDDQFRGSAGLRMRGPGVAEIGYALTAAMRGRGVMSRAVGLLLTWGFDELGLEVVHWRAEVGNWPSRRVAWARGFRVEGTVRSLLPSRDGPVDAWIGSIRRGDAMSPAHAWFDPPRLAGDGVVLRAHEDGDVPRIVEACGDETTRRWIPRIPDPYEEADAREHLLQIRTEEAAGRAVYWAVTEDGGPMLGEVGLFVRDAGGHAGEIGYWTHPEARGRGLMTAAARLAARHALLPLEVGGLGMDRLLLRAAVDNHASRQVAEKAGFTRTGVDRDADRLGDGTVLDDVRYDLLPAELPAPEEWRSAELTATTSAGEEGS